MSKYLDCPVCGGEVYDNTQENEERKKDGRPLRPDYACKDKEVCKWAMWPPKDGSKRILHKSPPPAAPITNNNGFDKWKYRSMIMSYCFVRGDHIVASGQPETTGDTLERFEKAWIKFTEGL